MPRIDIHTVLGFCPKPKKHEILVITRGATASINFDLFNKVYKLKNIDQFTLLFKQGKDMWAFPMIECFIETEKGEVKEKDTDIYYEGIKRDIPNEPEWKFIRINDDDIKIGESVEGLFKPYDLPENESVGEYWQFNSHYSYFGNTLDDVENGNNTYSYINFRLSSKETAEFKVTDPDCLVECEAAIRLNTDALEGMHGLDSVVITPMHPIAVVDSLYSRYTPTESEPKQRPIVSDTTYCSEDLYCND